MKPYATATHTFTTPRGNPAHMTYRLDTSDWNTVWSCLNEDEYGLKQLDLTGEALDIGAHIGGVAVGLLIDNPALQVTAVEPVPWNVALLEANLEQNGVADRATVIAGAAGFTPGLHRIHFGYQGSETAEHHAFIGNISMFVGFGPDHCPVEIPHEHADVPTVTLAELLPRHYSDRTPHYYISFAKIDCEGGEWEFLKGPVERVARWHGEWHPTEGRTQADFTAMLPGYTITYTGPEAGPQGFAAVRQALMAGGSYLVGEHGPETLAVRP